MTHIKTGGKHVLKFSIFNYLLFLFLLIIPFKINQLQKFIKLVLIFVIGFSFALLLLNYTHLKVDVSVIKFAIPSLALFLILLLVFKDKFSLKIFEYLTYFTLFSFSFLNGLGVYNTFKNVVEDNINNFTPMLLTVLGAVLALIMLMALLFLLKFAVQKIKVIQTKKWEIAYFLILSFASLYLVLDKIFI